VWGGVASVTAGIWLVQFAGSIRCPVAGFPSKTD